MVELRPRKSKAAVPAAADQVAATPKSTKTPKTSKRKAIDDVSPTSTKKSKSVKTPAKPKETEEPAKEASASTPQVKKTPAKAKAVEEVPEQESQKTPVTKPKKVKTPSKVPEAEKTPVSKAKKEKTPAKPQGADEIALKEQEKTPASKSKKEKTPAKAKTPKDNLPKAADQSISEKTESTPAKSKPTPKAASQATQATPASKAKGEKTSKTPKSGKKSVTKAEPEQAKQQVPAEEAKDEAAAPEEDEIAFSEEELDEQTKTLVRTIDSGDEDEPGTGVILFAQGQDVGEIPAVSKKEKKAAKKALAALKEKEDTGVVYIGRLPHGFYEHEMKSYFSQFGPIRNLRVSRNKHTGKAKHFGFIEFEELSTAEIVAKTMDNYLLFGHILKCSVIPKAQVNSDLFKGANKRYKPIPWNKMESKHIERPMLEDKWTRKINKENKRRAERAKQLQAIGYEFTAPEVKGIDAAKVLAAQATSEEATNQDIEAPVEKAAIEAPPTPKADDGGEAEEKETTPQPVKRGRGRPAKTPQKKATETPRKTSRRTKA